MRSVTLKDIANAADLSVSAVSMALADDPQISRETRAQVQQLSQQLNYQPRRRRGSRRRGRLESKATQAQIHRIGFIPVGRRATLSVDDLHMISRQANQRAMRLDVSTIPDGVAEQQLEHLQIAAEGMDGLLLFGAVRRELLEQATMFDKPCVLLGCVEGDQLMPIPNCHIVGYDVVAMGQLATRRLIEAGHTRIGFSCPETQTGLWYERWLTGYRYAHLEAGLTPDPRHIFISKNDDMFSVGKQTADAMLALKADRPTGYVVPEPGSASIFLQHMASAGTPVSHKSVVLGSTLPYVQKNHLADCLLIVEKMEQLMDTGLQVLRQAIDGAAMPPARLTLPFDLHHFSEAIGPNA